MVLVAYDQTDQIGTYHQVTDFNGRQTRYYVDPWERVVTSVDTDWKCREMAYEFGFLHTVTDAEDNEYAYVPDSRDLPWKAYVNGVLWKQVGYSDAKRVSSVASSSGKVVTFEMDQLGRVTKKQYSGESGAVTFVYRDESHPKATAMLYEVDDTLLPEQRVTTYRYDPSYRLIREDTTVGGTTVQCVDYAYWPGADSLMKYTPTTTRVPWFHYYPDGSLALETARNEDLGLTFLFLDYAYDLNGLLAKTWSGGGTQAHETDYGFDDLGRVTGITYKDRQTQATLFSFAYGLVLRWSTSDPNTSSFRIRRDVQKVRPYPPHPTTPEVLTREFHDNNALNDSQSYFYDVRALNCAGDEGP